ncbi:InlB B-repeat-containing protein [Robinsoniella peoriensis]|uniref:InlB B-repeat-containing protein n=1 Tax=Robinsoniella peoriensis TaxID=180332 RepID=UPI003751ED5E
MKWRGFCKRVLALVLAVVMVLGIVPVTSLKVQAKAWDPNKANENLEIRFWEDQQPGVRFYINAGARYILEHVKEPSVGTNNGEWSVMDLLRGMYIGADYMNYIEDGYFNDYLKRVEQYVIDRDGVLHFAKSTEWSRVILALSALGYDITDVGGYNFIDKFSSSYQFSYLQGLNGPIWEVIAMNTGEYSFIKNPIGAEPGDVNNYGRLLEFILKLELQHKDGSKGGFALTGNVPDPDMTGMALQALAPYYLDQAKYEKTGSAVSYMEFKKVVERGIFELSKLQAANGAFKGWGNVNAESTVQVIVALTALGIDPKSSDVELPNIGKSCSFIQKGMVQDGVYTNNMIDALLTFWASRSGASPGSGGFKHVTAGDDGGGGSGTVVNGMATDQAVYGLIAYDRFKNGENSLYDMTDMIDGSYQEMAPASFTVNFDGNDHAENFVEEHSPYAEVKMPVVSVTGDEELIGWNTKQDGTGSFYQPGEILSMPEQDITLYAQYGKNKYTIKVVLNEGTLAPGIVIPNIYTPYTETIILPTAEQITKNGCIFKGWYKNPSFTGTPITEITKGSYGDMTLYAKWIVDYVSGLNEFFAIINKLNVQAITISDRSKILRAREIYDGLYAVQQAVIDSKYYRKLLRAEEKLAALEASMEESKIVIELINNLGNEITLQDVKAISEARAAYDALSEEEQEMITNYSKLIDLEAKLDVLIENDNRVKEVEKLINSIGDVSIASQEFIEQAREAYNNLNEEQKALVNERTLRQLETAEETLSVLKESAARIALVQEKILAIPDLQELSLEDDSFQLITEAHAAYLTLSGEENSQLEENILDRLVLSEQILYDMAQKSGSEEDFKAANEVVNQITSLGGVASLESESNILGARASYEALTGNVRKVLVENYYSLVRIEMDLSTLKNDKALAAEMMVRIAAIGEVTFEKESELVSIRRDFGRMTANQKKQVENYQVLVDAEMVLSNMKYNNKKAKEVLEKITAIGTVSMGSKDAILAARAAYDNLKEEQLAYISQQEYQILTDAEKEYDRIFSLQLKSIGLNSYQITVDVGSSANLQVSYNPVNTINDKTVKWSSSNNKVVTVQNGQIRGIRNGEAAITASVGKFSVMCRVVVQSPLKGLTINQTNIALVKGQNSLLSIGYVPENTTSERNAVWSSSNHKVATVSGGRVTAQGAGTAVISAKVGNFTIRCNVSVSNYSLTYVLAGGSNHSGNPVVYNGTSAITLKSPQKAGYLFKGWYTDRKFKKQIKKIQKGNGSNYTLYAKWEKVKKPAKPVIKSISNSGAKKLKVVLKKKVKYAQGYEIQYALDKRFRKSLKTVTTKSTSKTLKKLKKKKTYYVRVRAYRKDSMGKYIYSSYSLTKKLKIKK